MTRGSYRKDINSENEQKYKNDLESYYIFTIGVRIIRKDEFN